MIIEKNEDSEVSKDGKMRLDEDSAWEGNVTPLPQVERSRMLLWSSKLNRCGGVLKRHHGGGASPSSYWRKRFFWIETPSNESENYVLCYSGSNRGRLELQGARVTSSNHSCDFIIRARGGEELRLRARTDVERAAWVSTLRHVIDVAHQRRVFAKKGDAYVNKLSNEDVSNDQEYSSITPLRIKSDDHQDNSPLSTSSRGGKSSFYSPERSDGTPISDQGDYFSILPSRQTSCDENQSEHTNRPEKQQVEESIQDVIKQPPRPSTPTKPKKNAFSMHSHYDQQHRLLSKLQEERRPIPIPNTLNRRHASLHHERVHRKHQARRRHDIAHPPPARHQHHHSHSNATHHQGIHTNLKSAGALVSRSNQEKQIRQDNQDLPKNIDTATVCNPPHTTNSIAQGTKEATETQSILCVGSAEDHKKLVKYSKKKRRIHDNLERRVKTLNQEIHRIGKAVFLVTWKEAEVSRIIANNGDMDSQRHLASKLRNRVQKIVKTAAELQASSVHQANLIPEDRWFVATVHIRSLDLQNLISQQNSNSLSLAFLILNGNVHIPPAFKAQNQQSPTFSTQLQGLETSSTSSLSSDDENATSKQDDQ